MSEPLAEPAGLAQPTERRLQFVGSSSDSEQFRTWLIAALQRNGFTQSDIHAVVVSSTEAIDNALIHGRQGNENSAIRIDCRVSVQQVWLEVADDGPGFHYVERSAREIDESLDSVGGRGLTLIFGLMHEVKFNAPGNVVQMVRRRAA